MVVTKNKNTWVGAEVWICEGSGGRESDESSDAQFRLGMLEFRSTETEQRRYKAEQKLVLWIGLLYLKREAMIGAERERSSVNYMEIVNWSEWRLEKRYYCWWRRTMMRAKLGIWVWKDRGERDAENECCETASLHLKSWLCSFSCDDAEFFNLLHCAWFYWIFLSPVPFNI